MGLHVGGIYVRTSDQARVVKAIKQHWEKIGARPLEGDPLDLEPLGVQKTGKLGFLVCPAEKSADGETWIGIYDSERYHADGELARVLATELDTDTVIYAFTGSVDQATANAYGPGAAKLKKQIGRDWGDIEAFVSQLPFALLYYNKVERKDLDGFEIFGFEDIPFRKNAGYRGPSDEERAEQDKQASAKRTAEESPEKLRALWKKDKSLHDFILTTIYELPEQSPATKTVLEFADEIIADNAYWRTEKLARAAILEDDEEIFERALEALGERAMGLEFFANKLLQDKDYERALRVLRGVCAAPSATLTAWNNLAYTLIYAPRDPKTMRALLEEAEKHGAQNPAIFHNTACAWLEIGAKDEAFRAVESAVTHGYTDAEKMKTDTDLDAIRSDPRFIAAFEKKASVSFDDLVTKVVHKGKEVIVARPVVKMDFFVEPLGSSKVGKPIAKLLEMYLADIPKDAITFHRVNGPWKKLAKATRTKNSKKLIEAKDDHYVTLKYRGDTDDSGGAPTPYGIDIEVWGREDDDDDHTKVPTVSLWFPVDVLSDVENVLYTFVRYAKTIPTEAATCSLHLLERKSDYAETWWRHVDTSRLIAHETHPFRAWTKGVTPGACWLTYFSKKLFAKIDESKLGAAKVLEGTLIRASRKPTFGVAKDWGALPSVSRALAPLRMEFRNEDSKKSYERWDALEDSAWEN